MGVRNGALPHNGVGTVCPPGISFSAVIWKIYNFKVNMYYFLAVVKLVVNLPLKIQLDYIYKKMEKL